MSLTDHTIIIDLTEEQQSQLKPFIDKMLDAHRNEKPVMLLGQIAINLIGVDKMIVGIIPHEQAIEIERIRGFGKECTDES